jgi:AcrR family transcriptional regulator
MAHHFPSKAALMVATMEHIRSHMASAHAAKLPPAERPQERFAALIDVLWSEFSTPIGVARIELLLASRSDPTVGPEFSAKTVELDRRHKDAVWATAQQLGIKDRKVSDAIVQLYAAALRGLSIDALQPAMRPGAQASVNLLRDTMLMWESKFSA